VPYYPLKKHGKFQDRQYRDIAYAIEPLSGAGLAQEGQPKHMKRFSTGQEKEIAGLVLCLFSLPVSSEHEIFSGAM
jgi:hypothetical protein